jgi:hypothetical protein
MTINTAQLRSEIQTDPIALGYAAPVAAKNWQGVADILNNPNQGAINVSHVNSQALQSAVNPAEYLALSQGQRDLWAAILAQGSVSVNDAGIKAQALAVFTAAATSTRAAFTQLLTKPASRAEALFGLGTVIGYYDVYYLGL